jgi:hypothetical protein
MIVIISQLHHIHHYNHRFPLVPPKNAISTKNVKAVAVTPREEDSPSRPVPIPTQRTAALTLSTLALLLLVKLALESRKGS